MAIGHGQVHGSMIKGLDILDPLFAVALHIGLAEGLLDKAEWYHQWRQPSGEEWFHFGVFGLGLATLLFSWLGYSISIRKDPLQDLGKWNWIHPRFYLDILFVTAYTVMLIAFEHLTFTLCVLTIVAVLYVVWDCVKVWELSKTWGKRQWVSVWFAILFVFLVLAHFFFNGANDSASLGSILVLIVAYVFIALYRLFKAIVQ